MLSEEHETQLACAMVLLDLLEKNREEGHETEELKNHHQKLREWIDGVMKTLDEEEHNQAIDRYTRERSSGEYKSLPNLLQKFSG